jgi:hypothetical protein
MKGIVKEVTHGCRSRAEDRLLQFGFAGQEGNDRMHEKRTKLWVTHRSASYQDPLGATFNSLDYGKWHKYLDATVTPKCTGNDRITKFGETLHFADSKDIYYGLEK